MGTTQPPRVRAAVISLGVGAILMAVKFVAYAWTGSSAILTDALESIVNVAAASFLLGSLLFARIPADRNHPYGHGKIEFMSAAFEGGLITFAAISSFVAAGYALWRGPVVQNLDRGLVLTAVGAGGNGLLGAYLLREGKRSNSLALEADGKHVLSDTLTSAVLLLSLGIVKITGIAWFDPACAILLGLVLARTGMKVVRKAAGALLDEADPKSMQTLLDAIEDERVPGLIRVHHLRGIRFGPGTHVDAHLVMPEYWPLDRAHALCDAMEQKLKNRLGNNYDVMFHSDPCRRAYCAGCDVENCDIRQEPFTGRPAMTLEEAERPDPP
jgi:cation diffusion facilitator family transporter